MDQSVTLESMLPVLERHAVSPADLLTAITTLPDRAGVDTYGGLLDGWTSESVFLDWARFFLQAKAPYSHDAAVAYAKRAVCRRIDALLVFNYLEPFADDVYPKKLEALREIGINGPEVVQDLVITVRNDVEHAYANPDVKQARHAVEIADLFLASTREEAAIEWRAAYGCATIGIGIGDEKGTRWTLRVPPEAFFLFMDCFGPERAAKLVNGPRAEVLECPLNTFSRAEALQLAKGCRHRLLRNYESRRTAQFYQDFRSRTGIG